MILNDASQEGVFKDNPEVQSMQLRSVLCLPVIKQSRMIGVLYLENRLSDSVFTSAKTQMTELLTSQAAISLENSRLMEEMKKAEDQVKKSLGEKVVLLKEIHHRVKNNLQIIHSMLNLQLPFIKDEQAIELFKDSQNRVHSMALIHEKLYQSESLTKIDLAEYIRSLTTNAIKFTEKGKVQPEFARHQRGGRFVTEIRVVDTGIGIREEDHKKLFEGFRRWELLDSALLRPREGAGLGLHLSQKLAELIGGEISFKSVYGQGSTFPLTLK